MFFDGKLSRQPTIGMSDFLRKMPLVARWIEQELRLSIEDVVSIGLDDTVVRDYAREAIEHSPWQLWKPGDSITVILKTATSEYRKAFSKEDWRAQ